MQPKYIKTDEVDVVYKLLQYIVHPKFKLYMTRYGEHDTWTEVIFSCDEEGLQQLKDTAGYLYKNNIISEKEYTNFMIDIEISLEDMESIKEELTEELSPFWATTPEKFIERYCKERNFEITAIDRELRRGSLS